MTEAKTKINEQKTDKSKTASLNNHNKKEEGWYGTGRRKTSVARVRLTLGSGEIIVNDKPIEEYFPGASSRVTYEAPLKAVGRLNEVAATIKVVGGGKYGQLEAVAHGFARALIKYDEALRPTLSKAGHLRRDPRMKESRHFGLMGARKAKQSPKR
jgi:small subunit ribosomal protein S9